VKNFLFVPLLLLSLGFQACGQAVKVVDTPDLLETLKPESDSLRIINFWATWCKPCVAEMPHLKSLAKNHPEISFVFVSLDFKDDVAKVEQFVKVKELPGTQLLMGNVDYNSWIPSVHDQWDGSIPFTLVQYKGETHFHRGSFASEEELTQFINQIKS
jgi:thiol-disulfide isomerase/thioredoxin